MHEKYHMSVHHVILIPLSLCLLYAAQVTVQL